MDSYVYAIAALLPLTAAMVVLQTNPYRALVVRGILGAIAALVYTVLGAADVALTEALVGTLLAITLYAIAVRSSLVLRLGVLQEDVETAGDPSSDRISPFQQSMQDLRTIFNKYHLRVELVSYIDPKSLQQGLLDKEVHAICDRSQPDRLTTRLRRIYEIVQAELPSFQILLKSIEPANSQESH
jgi:putative multicomponent Na+:H+ antiporter subunit B